MREHRWLHDKTEVVADQHGVRYKGSYIVGGTIVNHEVLRLARRIANLEMLATARDNVPNDLFVEISWCDGAEPWISGLVGRCALDEIAKLEVDVADGYPMDQDGADLFGRYVYRFTLRPHFPDEIGGYEAAERVSYRPWRDDEGLTGLPEA